MDPLAPPAPKLLYGESSRRFAPPQCLLLLGVQEEAGLSSPLLCREGSEGANGQAFGKTQLVAPCPPPASLTNAPQSIWGTMGGQLQKQGRQATLPHRKTFQLQTAAPCSCLQVVELRGGGRFLGKGQQQGLPNPPGRKQPGGGQGGQPGTMRHLGNWEGTPRLAKPAFKGPCEKSERCWALEGRCCRPCPASPPPLRCSPLPAARLPEAAPGLLRGSTGRTIHALPASQAGRLLTRVSPFLPLARPASLSVPRTGGLRTPAPPGAPLLTLCPCSEGAAVARLSPA